jgi:Membrane proteins related to metalloendopeptidases
MSKIALHDLFIGDFAISQKFGANPSTYNWIKDVNGNPIKGHNGVDFGYGGKNGVQLLNPFPKGNDVVVSKVSFDSGGYGWYLRMWDKTQKFVILFGHGQEVVVKEWQNLAFEQLVAYGDNTGWSTGPHLHVGGYFVDDEGNRINRDNGFDGYIDLLDKNIVEWKILNPKSPAELTQVEDNTPLAVCLRDRKDFWDKLTAEQEAHKKDNEEKDNKIKQLTTDSAKIGCRL